MINLDNGVKVIESTAFNQAQDFEMNIREYIDPINGVTAEFLAKKLGISPLVARSKLEVYKNNPNMKKFNNF